MEEKNIGGFKLIKQSASTLKGVFGKAFLATIIYMLPIIALCIIPYAGWVVAMAAFGYLTLGYINYMQKLINKQNPNLSELYVQKEWLPALLIGVIMVAGTLVGSILFIVPGVIMIAYFSFGLFVLNEEKITNVTDTLNVASRRMKNKVTQMFSYKALFYLIFALIAILSVFTVIFASELYFENVVYGLLLGVGGGLVIFALLALVMMYFYAANIMFFKTQLENVEVEDYTLTTQTATPEKTEVVEKAEEVKKPAAKKAAPKTSTKKSTTTKSTAAKPAAKKTTTTKK